MFRFSKHIDKAMGPVYVITPTPTTTPGWCQCAKTPYFGACPILSHSSSLVTTVPGHGVSNQTFSMPLRVLQTLRLVYSIVCPLYKYRFLHNTPKLWPWGFCCRVEYSTYCAGIIQDTSLSTFTNKLMFILPLVPWSFVNGN